jgi:hypothetical protein
MDIYPNSNDELEQMVRFEQDITDHDEWFLKDNSNSHHNILNLNLQHGRFETHSNFEPMDPSWMNYGIPLSDDTINIHHIDVDFLLPQPHDPTFHIKVDELFRHRTVLIRSPMGTGKTKAYMWYLQSELQKQPDLNIIIICSRVTLVSSLVSELNRLGLNFKAYSEFEQLAPSNMQVTQRLVIQIDSLPKLVQSGKSSASPYDIVIVDESESACKHFDAETMKRRGNVWRVFVSICNSTTQLLVFDADLGGRTVDIISSLRIDIMDIECTRLNPLFAAQFPSTQSIRIWINDKKTDNKTYIYVDTDSSFHYILWKLLEQNNNLCIVCNCKKKAIEFEAEISKKFPLKKVLLYHSGSSDQQKQAVGAINELWIKYDVVIFTPTIGAGVDFNPPDGHFHYVMAYGIASSNPVREFMQMIGRVRYVKNNYVIVYLPNDRPTTCLLDNRESILQQVCNDYYQTPDPLGLLEPMQLILMNNNQNMNLNSFRDHLYTSLYCWNRIESARSSMRFAQLFHNAVQHRGGKEMYFIMDSKNIHAIGKQTNELATDEFTKQIINIVDAKVSNDMELNAVHLRVSQNQSEQDRLIMEQYSILKSYRLNELKVTCKYRDTEQRACFIDFIRYHGQNRNIHEYLFFLKLMQPISQLRGELYRKSSQPSNLMLHTQQEDPFHQIYLLKGLLVLIGSVRNPSTNITLTPNIWTSKPRTEFDVEGTEPLNQDAILDTATVCADMCFNTLQIESNMKRLNGHTWIRNNRVKLLKHFKIKIRKNELYKACDVTKALHTILQSKLGLSLLSIGQSERTKRDPETKVRRASTTWQIGEPGRLLSMLELAYVRETKKDNKSNYCLLWNILELFTTTEYLFRWSSLTGIYSPFAGTKQNLLPMKDINELDLQGRKKTRMQIIGKRTKRDKKKTTTNETTRNKKIKI